ncbi:MAG: hypothetical protein AAGH41_04835 [Pseudomonadota bacterium]
MFKVLAAAALAALMALKPISEMTVEEVAKRIAELTLEIALAGGQATPEQQEEMEALERRLDELTSGTLEETEAALDEADAVIAEEEAKGPPDQSPIDAIGRAFQKAMPDTWEGETCNKDVKDRYRNLTPWYKANGFEDRGQQYTRVCGDRTDQWFTWEISTFEVGEVNPEGYRPDQIRPEDRDKVIFKELCGYTAMITPQFNLVSVNVAGRARIIPNASYNDPTKRGNILAMQEKMIDAVKCDIIAKALENE